MKSQPNIRLAAVVLLELAVAGVLVFGLCMCVLYRKTGSIVLPILWQALVFDLALVVLLAYILQNQ